MGTKTFCNFVACFVVVYKLVMFTFDANGWLKVLAHFIGLKHGVWLGLNFFVICCLHTRNVHAHILPRAGQPMRKQSD